jgi:hypothetical protein
MGRFRQARKNAKYAALSLLGLLVLSLLIDSADFVRNDGLWKSSSFAVRRFTKDYAQVSAEMDRLYPWERKGIIAAETSGFWSGISVTLSGILALWGMRTLIRTVKAHSSST